MLESLAIERAWLSILSLGLQSILSHSIRLGICKGSQIANLKLGELPSDIIVLPRLSGSTLILMLLTVTLTDSSRQAKQKERSKVLAVSAKKKRLECNQKKVTLKPETTLGGCKLALEGSIKQAGFVPTTHHCSGSTT